MEERRVAVSSDEGTQPNESAESSDGVDLTLIDWMLAKTPLERLETLQDWVDGLTELRRGRLS